jgi:hypothetical protein
MSMWKHAASPQPRYQTIQGAYASARRFPWQPALLALCQRPATLEELAQATGLPTLELAGLLSEFCAHALVKRVAAAPAG